MSRPVRVRRRADRDTDAIADYIGARSSDAGRRFLLAVQANTAVPADNPQGWRDPVARQTQPPPTPVVADQEI
jgi:plasmid stabilization system protein ParE